MLPACKGPDRGQKARLDDVANDVIYLSLSLTGACRYGPSS